MLALIGLKKFRSFQKLNRIERGSVGLQELRRGIHASLPGSTRQYVFFISEFLRDSQRFSETVFRVFQRLSSLLKRTRDPFSEIFRDFQRFSECFFRVFQRFWKSLFRARKLCLQFRFLYCEVLPDIGGFFGLWQLPFFQQYSMISLHLKGSKPSCPLFFQCSFTRQFEFQKSRLAWASQLLEI